MLAEPKHGWTTFVFGDFACHPSYLTDVPADMLACAFSFLVSRQGQCYFDCEGTTCTFVLSVDGAYVIYSDNKLSIRDVTPEDYFTKDYPRRFVEEVINDIEKYLDGWVEDWKDFGEDSQERRNRLQTSIMNLRIWMEKNDD